MYTNGRSMPELSAVFDAFPRSGERGYDPNISVDKALVFWSGEPIATQRIFIARRRNITAHHGLSFQPRTKPIPRQTRATVCGRS